MDEEKLIAALATYVGGTLATELVADFLKLRRDCATGTLERASPGKFVETFVQCLQQLASGTFQVKPDVDQYLSQTAEGTTVLPEGLRLCGARLARSIYTLRNKRNIAHKNPVDPNRFDLSVAHAAAAWIMAELVRNASGITMTEAGTLIEQVHAPVVPLVEQIDGLPIVHADTTIRGEVLILLHSCYPGRMPSAALRAAMISRSGGSVNNKLAELCYEKLLHRDPTTGYRLTQAGFAAALAEIHALAA